MSKMTKSQLENRLAVAESLVMAVQDAIQSPEVNLNFCPWCLTAIQLFPNDDGLWTDQHSEDCAFAAYLKTQVKK